MTNHLSPRPREIGCATGATAREILKRLGNVYVPGIDRPAKAIQQTIVSLQEEMRSGRLAFQQIAIEKFNEIE